MSKSAAINNRRLRTDKLLRSIGDLILNESRMSRDQSFQKIQRLVALTVSGPAFAQNVTIFSMNSA
jgi:hypothetical protein